MPVLQRLVRNLLLQWLQFQSYSWSSTLDLRLHLITVLGSKRPAQPNPGSALTRNPFNLESHASLVRGHTLTNATTRPFTIRCMDATYKRRPCSVLSNCCLVSKRDGIAG